MGLALSFARLRLWTLLLLVAIGLQAAGPIRAPLERVPGSAFSAATIDVALASSRKAENVAAPAPFNPPLPEAPRAKRSPGRSLALAAPERQRPEPRGPPPRDHPARLPDSTAPPLA